jgi:Protein of unknown function (DUF3800)
LSSAQYVIYSDESHTHDKELQHGRFYGGCLLPSAERQRLNERIATEMLRCGLIGELKWQKLNHRNYTRMRDVLDVFFDLVEANIVRLRVMWLPVRENPTQDVEFRRHGYLELYSHFVIVGFGLEHHGESHDVHIEFLPDALPESPSKRRTFVENLLTVHATKYKRNCRFKIIRVSEVDSKKHALLQCVDVIIGALAFKMNDNRLRYPAAAPTNRLEACILLGSHVVERIRRIHAARCPSRYQLRESTWPGSDENGVIHQEYKWAFPYRQWRFRGAGSVARAPTRAS